MPVNLPGGGFGECVWWSKLLRCAPAAVGVGVFFGWELLAWLFFLRSQGRCAVLQKTRYKIAILFPFSGPPVRFQLNQRKPTGSSDCCNFSESTPRCIKVQSVFQCSRPDLDQWAGSCRDAGTSWTNTSTSDDFREMRREVRDKPLWVGSNR